MSATRRNRFSLIDASGRAASSTVRQTISGGRAPSGPLGLEDFVAPCWRGSAGRAEVMTELLFRLRVNGLSLFSASSGRLLMGSSLVPCLFAPRRSFRFGALPAFRADLGLVGSAA